MFAQHHTPKDFRPPPPRWHRWLRTTGWVALIVVGVACVVGAYQVGKAEPVVIPAPATEAVTS